jgi:hypothetical protein
MPKATAVWLVENTALSFRQIAKFCALHELEVKGIADGDVAQGIKGSDPITSGQLTRDEIKRAELDPDRDLIMAHSKVELPEIKPRKGPRYTPLSRRQDRPNAILWLVKNHPELKDAQIMRLVGTTKPTIESIREKTHWNSASLVAQDPVTLGLCSQVELDAEVKKSAPRAKAESSPHPAGVSEGSLLPTSETLGEKGQPPQGASSHDDVGPPETERTPSVADVFPSSVPRKSDDQEASGQSS